MLVLSARGRQDGQAAAERAGASRFIAKPFANAEVLAALRDLAGAGPGGAALPGPAGPAVAGFGRDA